MNSLVADPMETSACGVEVRIPTWPSLILAFGAMSVMGTASKVLPMPTQGEIIWNHTSSLGSTVEPESPQQTAAAAVSELHRIAGLTWEQLARVLGVSRRSLHFWASGRPINADNEEQLRRLLQAIRKADRGTARANREMLLQETSGKIPFDLLSARNYEDFVLLVGEGAGRRRPQVEPLSSVAQEANKPLSPEQQVEALQDRIHIELERGRAAKTPRNARRGRS